MAARLSGRRVLLLLAFALSIALSPLLASAQQGTLTTTSPLPLTSTQALSLSIASTNAFQVVFAAAPSTNIALRKGCLIQNTGSNSMYIYVHQGTTGTANKNASYVIIPPASGVQGGSFSCSSGAGGVIQDQIDITGTAADTFAATSQ